MAQGLDAGERVIARRYRLHELLGTGGMSTVWRGEDVVLHRNVAVKEVTPAGASEVDRTVLRERVWREARAAARLDHPGVLPVYDVVEEGSATYLVMQYVAGPSLSEAIERNGPLSPQRTAQVGLAVLGVLRAAHAHGIVHRDVKPSNVLLSRYDDASPGRVFLTDFGIAFSPGDSSLTSTGLLIGSPAYIAPERARGDAPAPAADLWSLGATLFTTVEGHPPFDGADSMATLAAVLLGEHAPYVRAGALQPVLDRLLLREPAQRMGADELEAALLEIAASAEEPPPAPPPPPPTAVNPGPAADTAVLDLGGRAPGRAALPSTGQHEPFGAARHVPPPAHVGAGGFPLRRPGRSARRRWAGRLGWLALALAVLVGSILLVLRGPGGESTAERPAQGPAGAEATDPVGLPPLPATADAPGEQLRETISALADLTARDPDAAGSRADEVLADLRRVEASGMGPRRSAAVVAYDAVGAAVAADELDAGVGQRVQEVLVGVARPERLIDLVQLVDTDPPAVGTAGPRLLDPLIAPDHEAPADQTAAEAAELLGSVREARERGELSEAFAVAAVPTLRELSDPAPYEALRDLVAEAERDPAGIGPAGQEVLVSLRGMVELPVFPQGNEAGELLELLRQEGQVTPEFRNAAIPVVVALVR